MLSPPLRKLFTMPPFGNNLLDLTTAQKEVFAKDLSFRAHHIGIHIILDLIVDTLSFLQRVYNPNKPPVRYPRQTITKLVEAHKHVGKLNILLEIKCQDLQPCIPLYGYSRTGQYLTDQNYISHITTHGQIAWIKDTLQKEIGMFRTFDTRQHLNNSVYRIFDTTSYIHLLVSVFLGFESVLSYDYLLHELHSSDVSRAGLFEETSKYFHAPI